jgi:RAT1-interacting protein
MNDRFKLIKWWAQSILIGIPKIVCGFRDDGGVVKRLEEFDTESLPLISRVMPPK